MSRGSESTRILGVVTEQLISRALQSEDAIVAGNRAGVIEWVNPAWTKLTGCAMQDTVDKPINRLLQEWEIDRSVLDFVQLNFLSGRRSVVEFPITNLDGRSLWIHLEVEAQRDASGDVSDFIAFVSDITDRREAELSLERHLDLTRIDDVQPATAEQPATSSASKGSRGSSSRLEALGLQSIGACHKLEPLAARIGRLCSDETAPTALEIGEIASLAEAVREEAEAVLQRARQPERSPRPVDVSDVAHCCCIGIARSLPGSLLLDACLSEGLPRAYCSDAELAALLTDLLLLGRSNVGDAWGTLSVTTGVTSPGEPLESDVYHARFPGTLYDDRARLFVEIHDTGDALDSGEVARLAEEALPAPEPGRVLALLSARARAAVIGGELHVHAAPGCGTRILLLLPASAAG